MLTKLYSKSSYFSIFLSYLYLVILIVFKTTENSNRLKINISLSEYLIYIILFCILFNLYNTWVKKQAKDDGISITDRSSIHLFLFPVIFSFLPSNIINLEWITAICFMNFAMLKHISSLPEVREKTLVKIGILLSISSMIVPYFFIYIFFLLTIKILPADNYRISKILAIGLPSLITWFLALTIKTFSSISFPFYKPIIQNENFYQLLTIDITSIMFIIITLVSLTTVLFINKRYLYLLERRTRYNRIAFFIIHLALIGFLKSMEALILLIYPVSYGLSLFSRTIKNKIILELSLITLLFFSLFNLYLSFESI
ncbi:MAG: hypothetical protein CMC04_05525 [Flavobacteriaceae bacterium]|nr:hypothetical protein [Flavobacteriaceae bacterium]